MEKLKNNKILMVIIAVVIIVLIAVFAFIGYSKSLDKAFDPEKKDTQYVEIVPGSTTVDIGNTLEEKGIIESASKFKTYTKLKRTGSLYQAGTYGFSPSMKLSEIAQTLIDGKTSQMTFTVPEGYTIYQIGEKLAADGVVDLDKFNDLLVNGDFDYDFLKGAQSGSNHLEGYLFPETYVVEFGASEETIINTMLGQFDKVLTDEMRKDIKKSGHTLNEIMAIASIVEREAKVDNERGKVSSVIYNRLKIDMPLQMCSTVQYVLGEQKEILTYADTEIESPYNTYVNPGLPPGPICCPGEEAIKAAIYPDDTDYLYFVVSEKLDGTQNFSSDIEKFEKDKAAYYDALEGKSGK